MSGRGGTGPVRCYAALVLSMLLAGCGHVDAGDRPPTTTTPEAAGQPVPSVPTKGPDLLDVEARNYADLEKRLAAARGSVVLDDSGPVDGPGVGFGKTARVKTAGAYTVTAACVGLPKAQIVLSLPVAGAEPLALDVDCSGVVSKVVELQEGYVGAALTRRDPTGPWTGAVAGVRITIE
jgi:hypothetical protein